ncbi:MAG: ribbon-helix-helix protein, CopG family [Armatimonadota bacterium]
MVRTQVQLTEEQVSRLRRETASERISMAEAIRQALEMWLAARGQPSREEIRRRALAIMGTMDFGATDVAVNHDKYLEEAYDYFHPSVRGQLSPDGAARPASGDAREREASLERAAD